MTKSRPSGRRIGVICLLAVLVALPAIVMGPLRSSGDSSADAASAAEAGPQVRRLYLAAFEREPDPGGFALWVRLRTEGRSLEWVAERFVESEEFGMRYGDSVSRSEFVRLLYRNVLDREPDPTGFSNWTEALRAGRSRGSVLTGFSESREFRAKTAPATSGPAATTTTTAPKTPPATTPPTTPPPTTPPATTPPATTPPAPTPPPASGSAPAAGTVGFRGNTAQLRVINSPQSAPAGTSWQGDHLRITAANVTLDGVYVHGGIHHMGSGTLTVRNSVVEGGYGWWGIVHVQSDTTGRIDFADSTFRWRRDSRPSGGASGSGVLHNVRSGSIVRCDISGLGDGLQLSGSNIVVRNNHIHGLYQDPEGRNHNDGIQIYSGTNYQIVGNRFEIGAAKPWSNGVIFTQGSNIGSLMIEGNFINGGGYQLHIQAGQATVRNNVFGPDRLWGTHRFTGSGSSAAWSGNTTSGGASVNR
jgi:hypothetical protein